jgi:hypothetical protein
MTLTGKEEMMTELDDRISELKQEIVKLEAQRQRLRDEEMLEKVERYGKQLVVEFLTRKPGENWGVFALEMPGVRELRIVVRAADDATQEAKDYLQAYGNYPKHSVSYVMFGDKFVGSHGGGYLFLKRDLTGVNDKFKESKMVEDAIADMGYEFLEGGEE